MTNKVNDETRMTNDEGMTKLETKMRNLQWLSSFGFRHCFGIRHLSFVIPSICRTVLVLALVLLIGGCIGRRITKANVDQVAEGMSKKQVESILGPPSDIDNKDFVIMKKTTYVYRQGKDSVTIVFKDDKVAEKQSTLSD